MLKMKNENGITLVVLVVTIIVMLIIAGISINMGTDSVNSTRDRKYQGELEVIQQACITEYTRAKKLGYLVEDSETVNPPANFVGTMLTYSDISGIDFGKTVSSDGRSCFLLNGNQAIIEGNENYRAYKNYFRVDSKQLEQLGVLDAEDTYIINYYTGEVYNETKKVSSEGYPLYIISVDINEYDRNQNNQKETANFSEDDW